MDRLDLYKQACLATEIESSNSSMERLVIRGEAKNVFVSQAMKVIPTKGEKTTGGIIQSTFFFAKSH